MKQLNTVLKLDANENPYGMSKLVSQAFRSSEQSWSLYPNEGLLKSALARKYGLSYENIILGNGSSELLDMIARGFLNDYSEAICSEFSFHLYRTVTERVNAECKVVSAVDFGHDLKRMVAEISEKTRVLWIANPNNPTGTFISYDSIRQQLEKVPESTIVVLDEAYFEYLEDTEKQDATKWLEDFPNLIIVRTFSKIYGLAGLRLGYAFAGKHVIERLSAFKPRFNVSSVGILAAEHALADQQFVKECSERNLVSRARLLDGLEAMGLRCVKSHGNFVMCNVGDANKVTVRLLKRGIKVLNLSSYGLSECIRITVGRSHEITIVLEELRHATSG